MSGSPPHADEDPDVADARQRALNPNSEAAGRVVNLRKVYPGSRHFFKVTPSKLAVDDLSLTLSEGRLFALLGQNGAGKSTTCSMLSGMLRMNSGDATLYGYSVKHEIHAIRKIMVFAGNTMSFSAISTLSITSRLYSSIKGLSRSQITKVAEERLKAVRLWNVRTRLVSGYSGGMKRRLSVVIATLGDPKVIFLDEVSIDFFGLLCNSKLAADSSTPSQRRVWTRLIEDTFGRSWKCLRRVELRF